MSVINRVLCMWYIHKGNLRISESPPYNVGSDAKMSKETYTCQKRPIHAIYQQRSMCVIYYAQMRPMYSWGSSLQREIWYVNIKRDQYMSKENYKCHVSTEVYVCDILCTNETYVLVRVRPTTSDLIYKCQKRPVHVKRELQMPCINRGLYTWYVIHKGDL